MLEFSYLTTADGSPTVRIGTGTDVSEAMHSQLGAFSETVYIYGAAIQSCLDHGFSPRVLSLGLGLGYVEILSAALFLKQSRVSGPELLLQASGESFEILPQLRAWFIGWVMGDEAGIPDEFLNIYDDILARTCDYALVAPKSVVDLLQTMLRENRWLIREELTPQTSFAKPFGAVCFDAFSSKSTPDLWTEEFLLQFFEKTADTNCVLSTYACTGALKRSLRASSFELSIRHGFSTKRDSTFAVKRQK